MAYRFASPLTYEKRNTYICTCRKLQQPCSLPTHTCQGLCSLCPASQWWWNGPGRNHRGGNLSVVDLQWFTNALKTELCYTSHHFFSREFCVRYPSLEAPQWLSFFSLMYSTVTPFRRHGNFELWKNSAVPTELKHSKAPYSPHESKSPIGPE